MYLAAIDIYFMIYNKLSGVKKTPCRFTQIEINKLYNGMQENIGCYLSGLGDINNFEDDTKEKLGIAEFEASWHVLREFETDKKIKSYLNQQRQAKFIEALYENKERFLFFNSRTNTLKQLDEINLINIDEYILKSS